MMHHRNSGYKRNLNYLLSNYFIFHCSILLKKSSRYKCRLSDTVFKVGKVKQGSGRIQNEGRFVSTKVLEITFTLNLSLVAGCGSGLHL